MSQKGQSLKNLLLITAIFLSSARPLAKGRLKMHFLQVECKSASRSGADPDLHLRGGQIMYAGSGRRLQCGPGKSPGPHWKLMTFSYFRDFLKNKFGKFRQHSENKSVSASIGVEHSPTLHILLRLASADCHCMLSGESRISSNMTISAFYRKEKLRFNVPRTYLCLIILDKIGLPLAIGQYRPFQMEPSHCHIISFSPFNKLRLF